MNIQGENKRVSASINPLNVKPLPSNTSDKSTFDKVKQVAVVAFSVLLSFFLFWVNPATFFISFVVGVAFSHVVQKAIDKITTFMVQYKWPVIAGCGVMAILVLPVFVAMASCTWSAYVGCYLSKRAQDAIVSKTMELSVKA